MFYLILKILFLESVYVSVTSGIPDQGKWDFKLTEENSAVEVPKSMFKGFKIYIQITCLEDMSNQLKIQWILSQTPCWNDLYKSRGEIGRLQRNSLMAEAGNNHTLQSNVQTETCTRDKLILVDEMTTSKEVSHENGPMPVAPKPVSSTLGVLSKPHTSVRSHPVYTITKDGIYILVLKIMSDGPFQVKVQIEMRDSYGYLSAFDWPLLPFYGGMCLVYVILGLLWLGVSFLQWRELIRIQFWIGGVILLGMFEKAMFYAEYQSINSTGESALPGAVFFAELVSCAKRSLARMLVIIVSLGFGIVKPRLGTMLHRVVIVGILYFCFASLEAYLRIYNESANIVMSGIPLALLDSTICWWIFTSLVHTTRTLRLRHNLVKLQLYQHFTHTLTFAVLASIVFLIYTIKEHKMVDCLTRWKELWIDDAYWHLLFSLILMVIMFLWRPMNNSQRYAFTPLLDPSIDDDDDEEVEQFVNQSMGVKLRPVDVSGAQLSPPSPAATAAAVAPPRPKLTSSTMNADEDMERANQRLTGSLMDSAVVPLLDSDEELMNTKFEVAKMQ